jgi:hypothetical protein
MLQHLDIQHDAAGFLQSILLTNCVHKKNGTRCTDTVVCISVAHEEQLTYEGRRSVLNTTYIAKNERNVDGYSLAV